MNYRKLGNTDTLVSEICLGSMTWGTQNTPEQAFAQIDCALDQGVNFIDTAEMYPATPLSAETQGSTETILGQWVKKSSRRSDVIIATKVTGNGIAYVDEGSDISGAKIRKAVERSLSRLQTDYIDLYQLHWPNRGSYHFRQWPDFDPTKQDRNQVRDNIREVLSTLDELVKAGTIRHIGLSNESCWGTSQYLQIAETENLPRVVTTQNEYNLMCRLFDLDFAELAHNEAVGLLAFSPLAAGMLTGKYRSGKTPDGSRLSMNKDLSGRYTEHTRPVLDRYLDLAQERGLDPAQLAIAFCLSRPFMCAAIIGATTLEQLQINLAATELTLDDDTLQAIAAIYKSAPIPM